MNQYGRITTNEPQPHVNHMTMVAMVPLLSPVSGYYTTFYKHIAMVLTPLRDPGKTMVEPHVILQGLLHWELIGFCGVARDMGFWPVSLLIL